MKRYYTLIIENEKYKFEEKVKEYLDDGWELVGGVTIDKSGYFVQAVYKKEIIL